MLEIGFLDNSQSEQIFYLDYTEMLNFITGSCYRYMNHLTFYFDRYNLLILFAKPGT